MNKKIALYLCLAFCVFEARAQKKTGYFGRNYFIGWEHSIRPLGNSSTILEPENIGLGKIKVEKLATKNRLLGLSFETMHYTILDGLHPNFPVKSNPQRFLTNRTYNASLKKYYSARGMAPVGLYVGLNLSYVTNSIDLSQNGWNEFSFGDVYIGFEMGKSFPLVGNRLLGNVSVGLNWAMLYLVELDPIGGSEPYNYNNVRTNFELNEGIYIMNVLKANVGISYALF